MERQVRVERITQATPELLDVMSGWMWNWWGKDMGYSMEKLRCYLTRHINPRLTVPQTYVLFENGVPAGMFQLSMSDLDVRPDVYPWLINVYVAKERRGQGYFYQMMQALDGAMEQIGLKRLYLYTRHVGLYERCGFSFVEEFQTYLSPGDTQRLYMRQGRPM